jgi:hypothetical protein
VKLRLPRRKHRAAVQRISLEGIDGRVPLKLFIDGIPEIRHVIEHKPRPRPTTITPVIMNQEGQQFRVPPINCDSRHTVPVYFPLAWLTGNPSDAQQCSIALELNYETRF